MSDNKNTFQNITISSDGISSARFTPEGMKKAMEQLIDEHKEFAEQARWGKGQLEVKEARIFELEGRLEAKERLLEEWGVDREKMVNKISELEMNVSGLKRDDELKAQLANRTRAPRVITADELKPGMTIAWRTGAGSPRWETDQIHESDIGPLNVFEGRKLVLLEDAPAEEPEPVAAEAIRESEPGSTFETDHGEVWEWDGSRLHIHFRSNDSMHPSLCDPEDLEANAVVRSTAPSRGDYSVKVPKVGDTISSDARAAELPEGTILLDDDADPWHKDEGGYWRTAARSPAEFVHCTAEPVFYTNDPLTILYLPEEDA